MKLYRFSPIENKDQLIEAVRHAHFASFKLCHKALGRYLPPAGNIGIFCHYQEEYTFLTKLREELTDPLVSFNGKYFRLYEPIVIAAQDGIPETTYEYLYIRRPDRFRPQVGDVDFVIDEQEYQKMIERKEWNDVEVYNRSDLGMLELFHPDYDVLIYLTIKSVSDSMKS